MELQRKKKWDAKRNGMVKEAACKKELERNGTGTIKGIVAKKGSGA